MPAQERGNEVSGLFQTSNDCQERNAEKCGDGAEDF